MYSYTHFRLLFRTLVYFLMLSVWPAIGAPFTGIGPLITEPIAHFSETKAQSLLPANFAVTKEVRLGEVTTAEIENLKKLNASSGGPLAVGFPRNFPEIFFLSENSLSWITLQDGSKVTQVRITSPGANALRLQLNIIKMDDGVELKFTGNWSPTEVIGPVTIQNIHSELSNYWSPTTSGDSITLEIHLPPKSTNGFVASISLLSHFATNPSSPDRAKVTSVSLPCEIDVACLNNENANAVANAVAKMIYTKNGTSYDCTGTLLNNTNVDQTPYFLTAAHCINDQATANTLQTDWFYRATSCGGAASPVNRFGGAQLLYTNPTLDVTFLRLYDTPPSGVHFMGWRTSPVGLGSTVFDIHHPNGDSAKISKGTVVETNFSFQLPIYGNFSNFLRTIWSDGAIEGGSSGSALLAFDSPVVLGTLTGGPIPATCQLQQGYYSPFSSVYPSLARWLQPATSQVNPQTGWWWNPSEGGRGFTIEVNGNNLFMAGYLYATDTGQAIWFVSGGRMSSSSTYQGEMISYGYGQTLTSSYIAPVPVLNVGTISLNFTDATHGILTWPGGSIPIERFNIIANGVNAPRASFQPETGWWWNPSENGRGFALEIQNGVMFLAGYMYESTGRPIWFSSANQMSSQSLYQGNWVQYANGQTLYGTYRPPAVVSSNVGSLQIQFQTTTTGTLTLPDGRVIPISRFRF